MLEWGRKRGGVVPILRDGYDIAHVRPSSLRERADVEMNAVRWQFFKRRGDLHAVCDGESVGMTASKPSILRQAWEIQADAQTYRIQPAGFLKTGYQVLRAGATIGHSGKASVWSGRPTLVVETPVPLEHQVFLLWVAFIMRRRASSASASGGGGAS